MRHLPAQGLGLAGRDYVSKGKGTEMGRGNPGSIQCVSQLVRAAHRGHHVVGVDDHPAFKTPASPRRASSRGTFYLGSGQDEGGGTSPRGSPSAASGRRASGGGFVGSPRGQGGGGGRATAGRLDLDLDDAMGGEGFGYEASPQQREKRRSVSAGRVRGSPHGTHPDRQVEKVVMRKRQMEEREGREGRGSRRSDGY